MQGAHMTTDSNRIEIDINDDCQLPSPIWPGLIGAFIIFIVLFAATRLWGDEALQPGGVELTALADGTPAAGADLAAVFAKPKTGDRRAWYTRAWDATTNNIVSNPKLYTAGTVLAGLAASGTLQELVGGDDDKSKKVVNPNPKEPRTAPSATVQGNNNDVTMPGSVVGSGPAVGIVGNYNTVTITEPVTEPVVTP